MSSLGGRLWEVVAYESLDHTPNANMADQSVGARDKSHGSEASWALIFCFVLTIFPQRRLASSSIWSVLFRCDYELLCF